MRTPGPLLAAGRDADIFEYGPTSVLRRSRDGRPLGQEARTMAYLRQQGYPVPAVHELSEDGTDLVIERVDGPLMIETLERAPWTVRHHGAVLADLHQRLHEIPAPDFLKPATFGPGDAVLHLDLHPLNIIMSPKGPVVIDWANARRGHPDVDVALVWALLSAGEIPRKGITTVVLGWIRGLLINSFLSHFDRAEVTRRLRAVVEWKINDAHISEREIPAMRALVERAEAQQR